MNLEIFNGSGATLLILEDLSEPELISQQIFYKKRGYKINPDIELSAIESPKKWCFESDGDCGNFLIPLDRKEEFNKLVELSVWDNYDKFNEVFSEFRIDGIEGCYSFENWELI